MVYDHAFFVVCDKKMLFTVLKNNADIYHVTLYLTRGGVTMIELKNINIRYDNKECIRNGNFVAYPYQITGIYGESGTGKSSLLYLIGMLSDQKCDYYYNNERLTLSHKEKAEFRDKNISYITQDSLLIETITVEKNIEFFMMQTQSGYSVEELLKKVNLESKKDAYPKSLSGGERQRVALACAIANESAIIIGDEITAALDEENKNIVMDILKEQANNGKIVILVSHEKNIFSQCERLYELDHLELKLKKETENKVYLKTETERKKVNIRQMYKLLFHERKRNKLPVLLAILVVLFVGASVVRNSAEASRGLDFTLNGLANNKILVLNDEDKHYSETKYGVAIRSIAFGDTIMPLKDEDVETISKLDHVTKVYPYYLFMSKHRNAMDVYRNGEVVEKEETAYDEWNSTIPDYYVAVPIYEEENSELKEGIYVSSDVQKKYNLLPGDDVVLYLEIPVAIGDCVNQYYDTEMQTYIGRDDYLTKLVTYKTKVIGFMEANSFQPEIYMRYEEMEKLFNEQQEKYKNGEIRVSVDDYYGEYRVVEYGVNAVTVFVDDYENILGVMNDIQGKTTDTYTYSEYLAMQDIIEETESIYTDGMRIGIISSLFFVIGALVIFMIYVSRNKSVYIMLRLTGKNNKIINKLMFRHFVEIVFYMFMICIPIYISASIPDILEIMNIMRWDDFVFYYSEFYNVYNLLYAYFRFTDLHLIVLIVSIFVVVFGGYSFVLNRYKKLDLIKWIRGD